MRNKKHELTWPVAWSQVQAELARHHAPDEVRFWARPCNVGWNYSDGKFFIFCSEVLYKWIEVPDGPDKSSNLSIVKTHIWPLMQRYNCKELVYRLVLSGKNIKGQSNEPDGE